MMGFRSSSRISFVRYVAATTLLLLPFSAVSASDCNGNGVDDSEDIARGDSSDCDDNGVPDVCDVAPRFRLGADRFPPRRGKVSSLVAADVDGDGSVDIVETEAAGLVRVLLNRGDGTFALGHEEIVEERPGGASTADVDGDGDLDILTDSLDLLRNRGDGSFERWPTLDLKTQLAVAGDTDGDGDLDIAALEIGETSLRILENVRGAFVDAGIVLDAGVAPRAVAFGDMNGDGALDLVVTTPWPALGGVGVFHGDGAGGFAAVAVWLGDTVGDRMKLYDLDADGDIDVVLGRWRFVAILWNRGPEGFDRQTRHVNRTLQGVSTMLAVADFDGDGDADILTAATQSDLLVLRNDGEAPFAEKFDSLSSIGGGWGPFTAGDFDADGDPDLVLIDVTGDPRTTDMVINDGDGALARERQFSIGSLATRIAAADIDSDGDQDLVAAGGLGENVTTVLQLERGTFGGVRSSLIGREVRDVELEDVDGDGDPDMLLAVREGLVVLANDAQGSFETSFVIELQGSPISLEVVDLDGDGTLDVATSIPGTALGSQGTVSIFLGDGFGHFEETGSHDSGPVAQGLLAADFDGDGDRDLVVAVVSGAVLLINDGGGVFDESREIPGPVRHGLYSSAAAGDFDGDGDLDLGLVAVTGGGVVLLNSSTDGDWTLGFDAPAMGAGDIFAVDVNADGSSDLVLPPWAFIGDGRGSFRSVQITSKVPSASYYGDLDGDGGPELVLSDSDQLAIVPRTLSPNDADHDGLPDACAASLLFIRGDANADGTIDVRDGLSILGWLFLEDAVPACVDAADVNDSGGVEISDAVMVLGFLSWDEGAPPAPGPEPCGPDPTPDDLTCESFPECAEP